MISFVVIWLPISSSYIEYGELVYGACMFQKIKFGASITLLGSNGSDLRNIRNKTRIFALGLGTFIVDEDMPGITASFIVWL